MQKAPPTPKGFRDIDPILAKKRREIIAKIEPVLVEFGFEPIETPTIEFAQTLTGKYGEEERLIYKFMDRGERELALRYDLTVPLARYVATYNPPLPFRRYQIGQVFRGENPQHGRWREFTQFDFDTVGGEAVSEDAAIIACSVACVKSAGLPTPQLLVNDRKNFVGVPIEVVRAIDKLSKIGKDGIEKELSLKGFSMEEVRDYIERITKSKPTEDLNKIFSILKEKYSLSEGRDFSFDPTLARGLDYYTGAIFEMKPTSNTDDLSIGSGGRYDNLIGSFSGKNIPASGFSFGLDRLVDILPNT